MPCAATTRCSTPPKASSACGKCRTPFWNRRRRCGSTSRAHGDRDRSTSWLPPMSGAYPSSEPGGIPTARAAERTRHREPTKSAFRVGLSSHSRDRLHGHLRTRHGRDAPFLRGHPGVSSVTRAVARLARPSRTTADAPTPKGSAALQLAFKVPASDVDRCAEELVRLGVDLLSPPTNQAFGHRTLFFRDPDGNLLEVYAEI